MVDPDFREERLREIADHNKREWRIGDYPGFDADRFSVEVVLPLRQLRAEGWFDEYKETKASLRGVVFVNAFYILGPINYLANQEATDQETGNDET